MAATDRLEEEHHARSVFIRGLVQGADPAGTPPARFQTCTTRTIVQFWDRRDRLPGDVAECIASWQGLEAQGFRHLLFDLVGARDYIATACGSRHATAFDRCYHPAMQADYFRLCYILREGGCYVDADDVAQGRDIAPLFTDGRLRIQPLCYDLATEQMVSPTQFTVVGAGEPGWIFYFNNNPMCASAGHPIVARALASATAALEQAAEGTLPEIQSTTGPGNLTRAVHELASADPAVVDSLVVVHDWAEISTSKWPLSYRRDARNWRLSNGRPYERPASESYGGGE